MPTYTINFINKTSTAGNFCIFNDKDRSIFHTLAWLVRSAEPFSEVPISWETVLYFFWAKTGELKPGVIFNAGVALPTNPAQNNKVTLTKQDGNYKFIDQKREHGTFHQLIETDDTIPSNQASVGIGLSGSAMLSMQVEANKLYACAISPTYWVMFGDVQQGQVLDPSETATAVLIDFPSNIYSMTATLNMDNSWTITQGLD